MPRDLVIGNGRLLVNLDRNLNIRDLYYPHVGLHNHVNGHVNRIGVWVDGQFSWLNDMWSVRLKYRPSTLITDGYAVNGRLGVGLRFNDAVHPELNLLIRKVTVENMHPDAREVRLFFSHDFRIYESDIGDTAFFHPFTGSMIHFKRDCYFLINGITRLGGISEYATGVKEFGGAEGTWRDAEDGSLSMHSVEQGSVDSTVQFKLNVPGNGSETLDFWIAVGHSLDEVENLDTRVKESSVDSLLEEGQTHWKAWLDTGLSSGGSKQAEDDTLSQLYERSLLTLITQIDRSGGIVAANDTDIMKTARAHYSYVWPRDGALVANALDNAGYANLSRRFFSFCASILPENRPYFLQKYAPDGTLGSSWHPWIVDGKPEVPSQQDSTALVLWSVGKHFDRWKDKDFVTSIYEDLVSPAADYIIKDLDPVTKLPKPSYDLWEQRRGIHLWTCCALYGALSAATKLAMIFEPAKVDAYRQARAELKSGVLNSMFDAKLNRFGRSLVPGETPGSLQLDMAIDSSMAGLFLFDFLPARDPRVVSTMQAIYDRLWVRTPTGGMARFEDDCYFRVSADLANVPGNPWFVTTLWMAEWYIAVANSPRDLEPALDLLHWIARNASESGLLAEQINPYTGQPLAVMPLTWSHGELVSAIQKYRAKVRAFAAQQT